MVSGSKLVRSSSPIISTIFKTKKPISSLFVKSKRFEGTSYCEAYFLTLKSSGIFNPSFCNASIKARSFAE